MQRANTKEKDKSAPVSKLASKTVSPNKSSISNKPSLNEALNQSKKYKKFN